MALLAAFNTRQCADPRDSVFALVGMAVDCSGFNPQMSITADYSQSLFGTYMNVFKMVNEASKRESDTIRIAVQNYSHILQFYLQCFTANYPDGRRRFKPPWDEIMHPDSFERWRMSARRDVHWYRSAQSSLGYYKAKRGHKKVFQWLEASCSSENANPANPPDVYPRVEEFLRWPAYFPSAVRQIAKLQLFVAEYGQQSLLRVNSAGKYTEILVSSKKNLRVTLVGTVVVDNETGAFKVHLETGKTQKLKSRFNKWKASNDVLASLWTLKLH